MTDQAEKPVTDDAAAETGLLNDIIERYPRLSQWFAGLCGFSVASWMNTFGWIPFGG